MKRSKKSKNNETKSKQQNREQLKEEGRWAGGCDCGGGGELQVRTNWEGGGGSYK